MSANVKAKSNHIEVAVGYEFSYATTETNTVVANVEPRTYGKLYTADTIVKIQYVNVKTQRQRASWRGWKNIDGSSGTRERIVEYSGHYYEYVPTKI